MDGPYAVSLDSSIEMMMSMRGSEQACDNYATDNREQQGRETLASALRRDCASTSTTTRDLSRQSLWFMVGVHHKLIPGTLIFLASIEDAHGLSDNLLAVNCAAIAMLHQKVGKLCLAPDVIEQSD